MEFREYKYIKAIADTGSFTKAAAQLYVSQPSLSHLVSRTEAELGVTLFDRNSKPIRLTYAGEVYMRHAQDIIHANEQMLREFRDLSDASRGKLAVGLPYERAAYMLPQVITMLRQEMPGVQLDVRTGGVPVLKEMVRKKEIQFAVMPVFGVEDWMGSTLIYEEELCLAAAPNIIGTEDLVEGTKDVVNMGHLAEKPLVLQRSGHIIREAVDMLLNAYQIQPKVALEVDGNSAAYRISTAGVGMCIVPRMTTNLVQAPGPHYLYRLNDKAPVTWEVRAIYRKDFYISNTEKRFFSILREAHQEDNYIR